MAKYCLKKPSKRMTCAKRFKIAKKVREHNRKLKKESKKNANSKRRKGEKMISVPNKCPFKMVILQQAENERERIAAEKKERKEAAKRMRTQKVAQKRKLPPNTASLALLAADAQQRDKDFAEKEEVDGTAASGETTKDKAVSLYAGEVRKTIENADIVVEVLDARDPLGSRSSDVEETVIRGGKRLVLLLNKIDLVPKENVKKWLTYLRQQFPTVAFKSSTQEQNQKLGHLSGANLHKNTSMCIGADLVMKLLGNYCRNKDIKGTIRVGIVGYPNVGKSSVINSLKRKRACNVGAMPGITKQLQEVELDKHIRLIDSPGVVLATNSALDAVEVALKNAVRVESLADPVAPVQAILRRCAPEMLMLRYGIPEFDSCDKFLALLARKLGRLRTGARPDLNAAAKHVLNEWNCGKLRYYTEPPEKSAAESAEDAQLCSSEIVAEFSKEFDLDALTDDQSVLVEGLPSSTAMDLDVLYNAQTPIEVSTATENDGEAMDGDAESLQKSQTVVTLPPKKRSISEEDVESMETFPTSLEIVGNVQLNRAIKKAVKRHKRKAKKLAYRTDEMTNALDMATINEDAMES